MQEKIENLNAKCEDPALWNNRENAERLLKERNILSNSLSRFNKHKNDLSDYITLLELAEQEGDSNTLEETECAIDVLEK